MFGALDASWSSRIPLIRQRLGLSDLALSVALTGPAVGSIVAAQIAPALVTRIGQARLARLALLGAAVTLPLAGLAPDLALLSAALLVWGAFLGTLDITMNAHGAALEQRRGSSTLSGLHASYSASVLLFAPLGALAARLHVSPALHFAVVGAVGVACASPFRGALVSAPRTPRGDLPSGDRTTLRGHPRLLALAAIGFCALIAEGTVINWSGVLLHQQDRATLALAPFGLTAFSAGMVIGRASGDWAINRSGHLTVAWRAALLSAAGMLIATELTAPVAVLAGYGVLGVGMSVLVPITFALASRERGVSAVWALSRLTGASYVGLFVGPPLVGLLSAAVGLRSALSAVAALLLGIFALTAWWSFRSQRPG